MRNQCDVPIHLRDHSYIRVSTQQADGAVQREACRLRSRGKNDQGSDLTSRSQLSASNTNLPQKRKRSSSSRPSSSSVEPPEKVTFVRKRRHPISPADLPVVSNVPPSPQKLCPTNDQPDSPVTIHNRSVEEYQQIYHEVVDDMLKFKNGRLRPYTINLGRLIKQKLWERLDRPTITTSANEDGLVHAEVSYGFGECPPMYEVDISEEPKPTRPLANLPQKRKRSSSSRPSSSPVEPPEKVTLVRKRRHPISPADLPVVSNVSPSPQRLCTTSDQSDGPVTIHNRSKNGPIILNLGRLIKQKLGEGLDWPKITTSANQDGLVNTEVSYGFGECPPMYEVDTSEELKPALPLKKRLRKSK